MHSRYQHLLQIAGTIAVVGFHAGVEPLAAGWTAVPLFFVLAGARMAPALKRDETIGSYLRRRIARLLPELACVYILCLALLVRTRGQGLTVFAVTAPAFLFNWTRPIIAFVWLDWVFIPLWFVGSLVQLQGLAMALRGPLRRASAAVVVVGAVAVGVGTRAAIAAIVGVGDGALSFEVADALYWTPFAHIEALAFGILVGRGDLEGLGRWLLAILAGTLALGAINLRLDRAIPIASLGYPVALERNWQFLWGYPVLAAAAASLASPANPLARWVDRARLSASWDRLVEALAGLTYGVYVFHGAWLVFGQWLLHRRTDGWPDAVRAMVLFAIELAGATATAWAVARCKRTS
ncbi:MAG: acyltransferase [Gemmataceae bacterium]